MKKLYVNPEIKIEIFCANEYIASTCGKQPNGKYIFKCDAAAGSLYYYPEGKGRRAELLGTDYTPCSKTHETDGPDAYYDGFVDYDQDRKESPGESRLVWVEFGYFPLVGKYVDNAHASASLTRELIDVVRS